MPAEPAPGQAAYEAYRLRLFDLAGVGEASQKPSRWDGMKPNEHGSWAAAEAAVAAPLNAELGRLREEAASLREQLAQAQAERDELEGEKGLLARLGMAQEAISDLAAERDRYRAALVLIRKGRLSIAELSNIATDALEGGG